MAEEPSAPVEADVEELQEPAAKTEENPDGSFTTEFFSAPVQYETAQGEWQPIDPTVIPTTEKGYDYTNAADATDMLFDETADGALVELQTPETSFSLSLEGASSSTASVEGTRVFYPEVFPGVNLRYDVGTEELKETLVLEGPDVPSKFTFTLSQPAHESLDHQLTTDGAWEFTSDGSDGPAFWLPAPVVTDSADDPAIGPASLSVERQGDAFTLDLAVDPGWLQSPDRVFPVLLDPTILLQSPGESADDFQFRIESNTITTPNWLSLGSNASERFRIALTFPDLSGIPTGATIGAATLKLSWRGDCLLATANCGGHTIDVRPIITSNWSASSTPSQVSAGDVVDSYVLGIGANSPATLTWNVKPTIDGWRANPSSNHGLLVRRATDNNLNLNGIQVPGRRYTGDPTLQPALEITWTSPGSTLFEPEVVHSSGAELAWGRYSTDPGVFQYYEVHRKAGSVNFSPDASSLIATIGDADITTFTDATAPANATFTYRIVTASGSATSPQKDPSNRQVVTTPPLESGVPQTRMVLQPGPAGGKAVQLPYYANPSSSPPDKCRNFGSDTRMRVGTSSTNKYRSIVSFDLRRIPADAVVSVAKLHLYHDETTASFNVDVHRVTTPWAEGTGNGACSGNGVTWQEARAGLKWNAEGGDKGPQISTLVGVDRSVAGWDTFDLKSPSDVFTPWITAAEPNFGFLIKKETESLTDGNTFAYFSDDVGFAPTVRPKLEITYGSASASASVPPTVHPSYPAPNSTVSGDQTPTKIVRLRAAAHDDGRIEKVQFFIGGVQIGGDDTAEPYAVDWATASGVANGPKTLTVKATDDAGSVTTSSPVTFTLDNSVPTTAITSPAPSTTVSGTVNLKATASDGDLTISKVEFFFDGILIGEGILSGTTYSRDWDTKSPTNPAYFGQHQLTSRAYSTSGLIGTSPPVTVTVDNSATYGTKYKGSVREKSTGKPPEKAIKDPELAPDDADTTFPYSNNGTGTGGALNKKPIDAKGPTGRARQPQPGKTPESYPVEVEVVNATPVAGGTDWTAPNHRLWYRWLDGEGLVVYEAPFGNPVDFPKNTTTPVPGSVSPPGFQNGVEAANYRLVFDIHYDDGTTDGVWFSSKGVAPIDRPVHVTKDRETDLGLEHFWHYEGEPVGAGMTHLTNVANGNSILQWTPFSSPGRGLATVLNLTYNSMEEHSRSPVGNNFSLSISSLTRFGEPLDLHANNGANAYIAFTDGDGTTHRFDRSGSNNWIEPPGVNLFLRQLEPPSPPERTWALTRPDGVTFYYNADGFPTSVEDLNGNRITFVLEQTDPAEDPGGPKYRITEVKDAAALDPPPANANRSYLIDYYSKAESNDPQVRGNIQRITDHTGDGLVFTYFPDGNLKTLTQEGGENADGSFLPSRTFTFSYTGNASSTEVTSPTAPQSSRLYSVTDPRGSETIFDYYFTGQEDPGTSPVLRYRLESRMNRESDVTSFAYDPTLQNAQKTMVTAPPDRTTIYTSDADGKVTAIGRKLTPTTTETTALEWTDFALTKVTEPSGAATRYTYNANGYPVDIFDQQSNNTHLAYELSCAVGEPASCTHVNHVTSVTDPRAKTWSFTYNRAPTTNQPLTLNTVSDPLGNVTDYNWDTKGQLITITDARLKQTTFSDHDPNGFPTKIVNVAESIETKLGFDDDGLLLWIQDPNHVGPYDASVPVEDYRTFFHYDSFSRLGAQSTPKSTRFERGVRIWTVIGYDANDNVIESFSPRYSPGLARGAETSNTYDFMDRIISSTGPDDDETVYAYDTAGRLTKVTTPEGSISPDTRDRTVEYAYDAFDRVTKQTRYDNPGGVPRELKTHYCYEALTGDLVAVVPPKGGFGSSPCDPANAFESRYQYFPDHTIKKVTGPPTPSVPVGATTTYDYDPNDNVTSITDAEGDTETRIYDSRNLLKGVVEPFNGTKTIRTAYQYDQVGNLVLVAGPRAVDTTPTHFLALQSNPDSALYSPTNPYVTSFSFDGANRSVREKLPVDGQTEAAYVHREYDKNGNLTAVSLPVTSDSVGAVAAEAKTQMTYFDPGWIRTSDNDVNPVMHFDYTPQGWQSSRTPASPGGGLDLAHQMLWRYAPDGMVVSRSDREGGLATYSYDLDNLLKDARDVSGISDSTEQVIDIDAVYGWAAQLTNVQNRRGLSASFRETTFMYDPNGNLLERTQDKLLGSSTDLGRTSVFTFDAANVLDTQTIHGPNQSSCSDDRRINNDFTQVGLEKLREIFRGSGTPGSCSFTSKKQTTSWDYFRNGKLKTLETKDGGGTILESHTVSYLEGTSPNDVYVNGHRVSDTFVLKNPDASGTVCQPGGAGCTARYAYDARDRLVNTYDGHGGRIAYTFDQPDDASRNFGVTPGTIRAGNVTTEETFTGASGLTGGTSSGVENSTYLGNQLTQVAVGSSVSEYYYDPSGNLDCVTNATGTSSTCPESSDDTHDTALLADYSYDGLERLVSFRSWGAQNHSASYTYDALDRVVRQVETHAGATDTTVFTHLGLSNNVGKEDRTGAHPKVKEYAYDAYGIRLAMTEDPQGATPKHFTYGYDVHGSVSLLLTDQASGQPAVQASFGYTPYGTEDKGLTTNSEELTSATGTPSNFTPLNPYRYTAKRYDTGSNTIDMGARRFGPDLGRFISPDLFMGALADLDLSADPLSQNRYGLGFGNPLSFVEWDGHVLITNGDGTAIKDPPPQDPDFLRGSPTLSSADSGPQAGCDERGLCIVERSDTSVPVSLFWDGAFRTVPDRDIRKLRGAAAQVCGEAAGLLGFDGEDECRQQMLYRLTDALITRRIIGDDPGGYGCSGVNILLGKVSFCSTEDARGPSYDLVPGIEVGAGIIVEGVPIPEGYADLKFVTTSPPQLCFFVCTSGETTVDYFTEDSRYLGTLSFESPDAGFGISFGGVGGDLSLGVP